MEALKQNNNKIISLKLAKRLLVSLIVVFVFEMLAFPAPTLASALDEKANIEYYSENLTAESIRLLNDDNPYLEDKIVNEVSNHLPKNTTLNTKPAGYHAMTAYNSEYAQTDGDPCTTANGFNVCKHGIEDTVAANFLPFGTKVKIPELFGNRVFIVRDRMNSRYPDRVDVWMLHKKDALKFGVRLARIEIVEP